MVCAGRGQPTAVAGGLHKPHRQHSPHRGEDPPHPLPGHFRKVHSQRSGFSICKVIPNATKKRNKKHEI